MGAQQLVRKRSTDSTSKPVHVRVNECVISFFVVVLMVDDK